MRLAIPLLVVAGVALTAAEALESRDAASGAVDRRLGTLNYVGGRVTGTLAYWRGVYAIHAGETEAAVDAFVAAAARHDTDAMLRLARMHRDGDGVPVDHDEALVWYLPLALQGHATAQFELARMIEANAKGPKDHEGALHWYRQAAAAGDRRAEQRLGHPPPGDRHEAPRPAGAGEPDGAGLR
jgi:TPR repeat protein